MRERILTFAEVDGLRDRLWASARRPDAPIYAVLDGARDERIYSMICDSRAPWQSLYDGPLPDVVAAAAPHLVQLARDDYFSSDLIAHGFGNCWGIFVECAAPFEEVRRHLRRFLRVRDPDGERLLFRFYDPRILRVFLATCTAEQLATFFGPAVRFAVEGPGLAFTDFAPPADRTAAIEPPGVELFAIRREQLAAFSQLAEEIFVERAAESVAREWPHEHARLGDDGARALVRHGIGRARAHGLRTERDHLRWINLMMFIGHDFDADPRRPWAAILADARRTPSARLALVQERALHLHRGDEP